MTRIAWIGFQVLDQTLSKTALFEISDHLAKRQNEVDFFGLRSRKNIDTKNLHMRVLAIPLRSFPLLTHIFYITTIALVLPFYVLLRKPNFVITEPKFGSVVIGLILLLFPLQLRPKTIMDIRSTPVELKGIRALFSKIAFNNSLTISKKIFDGFTIVTSNMKAELVKQFKINKKPIGIWTNGVNLELFNDSLYDSYEVKKQMGFGDKFVVFYHGSISAKRGILKAIESIDKLKDSYPDIVLFLIGSVTGFVLIEEQIRKHHLQNKIIIHAPVDYTEVPKYISMSDLCLVPLPNIPIWRYQCPLKLLEYLSMGKPVVAVEMPANREVLGDSRFAVMVSNANSEEFAKAIMYAYQNIEQLRITSKEGKLIIQERYDWTEIAKNLETFFSEFS